MQLIAYLKRPTIALVLILLTTTVAYLPMLRNGFVLDDHVFVESWDAPAHLSSIGNLLRGELPSVHGGVYRPVRSLLYLVYRQLFNIYPFFYHVHSLIVHLISTILVYKIAMKLLPKLRVGAVHSIPIWAFVLSLLFGLHPIHTESIVYLSASMEMTGVVFMLGALLLMLRATQTRNTSIGIVILSSLAIGTYEMTITLPLLYLLIAWLTQATEKKHLIRNITLCSIPLLVALSLRLFLGIAPRGDYLGYSFYHTQLTMIGVYLKYLWLLLVPMNISYIHEIAPGFESFMTEHSPLQSILSQSLFDVRIIGSLGLLLCLVGSAFAVRKRLPGFTLGVLWLFVSLLPVAYLLPQGIALAEKYLYIPSIGVLIAILSLLAFAMKRYRIRIEIVVGGLMIVAFLFGVRTFGRTFDWRNDVTLWRSTVKQNPTSALAHFTLGVHLHERQQLDEAMSEYTASLQLLPTMYQAANNRGNILWSRGSVTQALLSYTQALQAKQEFAPTRLQLTKLETSFPKTVIHRFVITYPSDWEVSETDTSTVLTYQGHTLTFEVHTLTKGTPLTTLVTKTPLTGEILQSGEASLPGPEKTILRIFTKEDKTQYNFFLQFGTDVLEITTSDDDPLTLRIFDAIVTLLQVLKSS